MTTEAFEYRVGTKSGKHAKPAYGGRDYETHQTIEAAQIAADELQPHFEEVWLERRPVGPWEPVP